MSDDPSTADEEEVEGDDATEERRLFGERREETEAFIASEMGVAAVELAADRVGGFSLAARCTATAIASAGGRVAVGTDEAVLVDTGGGFEAVDDRPAVAVGLDEQWLLAGTPDGEIRRRERPVAESSEWESVGQVDDPRRFDGSLLATGEGVYRVGNDLESLGLTDAVDVADPGNAVDVADAGDAVDGGEVGVFAATADGLYRFVDGEWGREQDAVDTVTVAGSRAHAIDGGAVLERDGGEWTATARPGERPVDLTHGESLYGVTEDGTVLVAATADTTSDGQGGWRSHVLGVRGVVGLAIR